MSLETKITFNSNGINWAPKSGEETRDFLGQSGMPEEAKNKLLEDAISILSRGVPPQEKTGFETGRVGGYVQKQCRLKLLQRLQGIMDFI